MLIVRKDFGAFMDRGTSGKDIIDQNDAGRLFGLHRFAFSCERNGTLKVFQALTSGESGLRRGGAHAFQGADHGELQQSAEVARDFVGLIVKALLFTLSVQRHWHQSPSLLQRFVQSRVGESLGGKASEFARKVEVFLIF